MRQMISSVAIGATLSLGLALGQAAAASAAIGHLSGEATQCTSVPYGWAGTTTIAPGQSFSTGMVVPSEPGVQLAVVAFDVSTVDPAPGAVAINIGGSAVADGVAIAGGVIAATNNGSNPVMLTRVELNLNRCYQVDSAGPAPATVAPAATLPASAPSMPAVPSGGLPETGQASMRLLGLAMSFTLLGAGLTLLARRRVTRLDGGLTGCGRGR